MLATLSGLSLFESLTADPYVSLALTVVCWLGVAVVAYVFAPTLLHGHKPGSRPFPLPEKVSAVLGQSLQRKSNASTSPQDRPYGEWTPVSFTPPHIPPHPSSSSILTMAPRSYRPFRWGPQYKVNMGIREMPFPNWIEVDAQYEWYHRVKAERIAERGDRCCRTAPEAWDGALELCEELCWYLVRRYPSTFSPLGPGQDGREGMRNLVTGEVFDLRQRPLAEDPMRLAARMVQEDLVIMFEGEDGRYRFKAGAVLLPGFWRLEDKFGLPLDEIHTSGDVPQFKEKLDKGTANLFRRLKVDAPVERNNYFIQVDDGLAWSYSIGSEDAEGIGWFSAPKNKPVENYHFRTERQTLRRLPRSGGIVFTIRTNFPPIVDIAEEPYVPGRLASALRSWSDDISEYKGKSAWEEVLLPFLDRKHEEQIKNGLDPEREEVETGGYPY